MKSMHRLFLALTIALTLPYSLPADDATAVASFKQEMQDIKAYFAQQKEAVKDHPMASVLVICKVAEKIKTVKTDALPEDLKDGYHQFAKAYAKMASLYEEWPKDPAAMKDYLVNRSLNDPNYMDVFQAKIIEITKEMGPAVHNLTELSKKYGFENIGLLKSKAR